MRLDQVSNVLSASPGASGLSAAKTATPAAASTATTAATTTAAADNATGATFSITATAQWSVSLQVSLVLNSGSATTPATAGAPDRDVDQAEGDHHGRPHVSQVLRQLSRAVRHDLQAIVRNNPDLDPAVREELRATAKAFRDDLRTALHDAGRGHDFAPATLLDGVQKALSTLADRLGLLIDAAPQPAEPVPAPAPEPTPAVPAAEVPAETPVPAAA
ncbi:MAG: hypothetical protein ACYDIE_12495 [Candidatus Krumholzibacteriia bacterium]